MTNNLIDGSDSVIRQDYDSVNLNVLLPGEIAGELQAVDEGERDYLPGVEAARINDEFDIDGFYDEQGDDIYNKYLEGRNKAIEAQDANKLQEWDNYYTAVKRAKDTYSKFNDCTLRGKCEEGNEDYYDLNKNRETDWKYTDQVSNKDLLKSLRRTYGNVRRFGKDAGKPIDDKELINMWMSDQAYSDNNLGKLVLDASTMSHLTDQQKKDLALQVMTYEKIQRTGEGSRDGWSQTADVAAAYVTDVANYGILATLLGTGGTTTPLAIAAKEGAKATTKKKIRDYLGKFLSDSMVKTTAKTAGLGAGFVGTYDLSRQSIKIQADIQDDLDWGEFTNHVLIGSAFGGTLGALVGGASKQFNNLATKYMIKNKIGDREFLKTIRENVSDEKSLYKFLKNLGWTRKEAKAELKYLQEQGFKYDGAEKKWVSGNQEYKPSIAARNTEETRHGDDVNKKVVPKPVAEKAQKVIDETYIDVGLIDLQIPFSRAGQNFFDWVNRLGNTVGPKVARTLYGSDSILVRSGLRREAQALNEAMAATDINVAPLGLVFHNFCIKALNSSAPTSVNKCCEFHTRGM